MNKWPYQSEVDTFYGNPRGLSGGGVSPRWYSLNMISIKPPFPMHMGSIPIRKIPIHMKCASSLSRILQSIAVNPLVTEDEKRTLAEFDGSFCYRPMRNSRHLSMHAYGIAIDFDATRNPIGRTPHLSEHSAIVAAFEAENWVWGGRWSTPDGMHFQAAVV